MGIKIVRYRTTSGDSRFGVYEQGAARAIPARIETTRALFEEALPALATNTLELEAAEPLPFEAMLSPITHPCRVIAQAMNYADHAVEVGSSKEARTSNVVFRKSSASLHHPRGEVSRPAHVKLLDYEVELGLVLRKKTHGPQKVDEQTLADYIGGLVVTNDVSARDVQVPEGQFYKGKSYRTFCPCGPWILVPTREELARWSELRLTLRVNGDVRQNALAGSMIHGPVSTLREITEIEDLDAGDLILTGTPGGVALKPPPSFVRAIGECVPEATKWRMFIASQSKRAQYLKPGDRMEATIATDDGAIDLGSQQHQIAQGR